MRKFKYNTTQQLWFDFGDCVNAVAVEVKPTIVEKKQPAVLEADVQVDVMEKPKKKIREFKPSDDVSDRIYKNPIDKKLLKEMLLDTDCKSSNVSAYVRELNKMVDVIFNKHFSKYYTMKEDLESDAVLAIYNKRQYYNPDKDAYNFIYAIMRNEITNKLSKLNRISLVEDYVPFESAVEKSSEENEIPEKIMKWTDYMLGDVDFNWVKIPKKEVLEVMVWLKIHERGQHPNCLPSYLKPSVENMNSLYKLLKLIITQ